jgi:hypothetical protein
MTVQGSSGWLTRLDEFGWPIGEAIPIGENVVTFSVEDEPEDLLPISPSLPEWITIEVTALDLRTAHLIFGSRLVFGYPRPLAINGREYRRRVRRR